MNHGTPALLETAGFLFSTCEGYQLRCEGMMVSKRRDPAACLMKSRSRWWFQIFFIFTPKIGEMIQFDSYFSKGLKPPTSSILAEFACFLILLVLILSI